MPTFSPGTPPPTFGNYARLVKMVTPFSNSNVMRSCTWHKQIGFPFLNNWFLVSVRLSSNGSTQEVSEHERGVRVDRGHI